MHKEPKIYHFMLFLLLISFYFDDISLLRSNCEKTDSAIFSYFDGLDKEYLPTQTKSLSDSALTILNVPVPLCNSV